jgi:cytochrome oxidase assembly protein ShyY1
MRRLRPAPWACVVLTWVVGALCIRLVIWQLDRPILKQASDPVSSEGLAYRRLRARGTFDRAHEVVLSNRSNSSQAGVHPLTPLRLDGAEATVLIDRGGISASQAQGPYPHLPIVLEASESIGGQPPPKPQTELELSEGPPMSYAIQWFAFAAILLPGTAAWAMRRPRPQLPGAQA